ncbi:hypothetical protein ACJX0J_021387, partial [Zea mays]
ILIILSRAALIGISIITLIWSSSFLNVNNKRKDVINNAFLITSLLHPHQKLLFFCDVLTLTYHMCLSSSLNRTPLNSTLLKSDKGFIFTVSELSANLPHYLFFTTITLLRVWSLILHHNIHTTTTGLPNR